MARREPNRERPPDEDYDRPLPGNDALPPLDFLPEREWLTGKINKVEYEYVYFKGKMQYLTDKDQNPIIDEETGEYIPRRQFTIEIFLDEYSLPNGEPRRVWVRLGASLGVRANLPAFLSNMGMDLSDEKPTPKEIIRFLEDKLVKIQMANKTGQESGKEYQQVIWDSVKPA